MDRLSLRMKERIVLGERRGPVLKAIDEVGVLPRAAEAFRPAGDSDGPAGCTAAVVAGSRPRGVLEAFINFKLLLSPGRQVTLARHRGRLPPPGLR